MPSKADIKQISSAANPAVKKVIRLRERQARNTLRLTIVEGVREVAIARCAGVHFQEIWICPELIRTKEGKEFLHRLETEKATVFQVTASVFGKIAFGDRQEGILAVAPMPARSLAQLSLPKDPLLIVVEQVEKPGNLGAILRTADAAGVDAVLVCEPATDVYNPNVVRASLSTVFCVPIVHCANEAAVEFLEMRSVRIVAANPDASRVYTQADLRGALAVVLGSEQAGLSDFWKSHAQEQVKIPMAGKADSLNVSTTAAILVYEALRQRQSLRPQRPASQ